MTVEELAKTWRKTLDKQISDFKSAARVVQHGGATVRQAAAEAARLETKVSKIEREQEQTLSALRKLIREQKELAADLASSAPAAPASGPAHPDLARSASAFARCASLVGALKDVSDRMDAVTSTMGDALYGEDALGTAVQTVNEQLAALAALEKRINALEASK